MAVDKSLVSGSTTMLVTRSGKKELKKKSEEWKEYSKAVLDVMGGVCFG